MAKYIYAKHFCLGVQNAWAKELYKAHLDVWNGCREYLPKPDFSHFHCAKEYQEKFNFKDYYCSFEKLIIEMKKNGFNENKSVLPVDKNLILIDGSHRLGSALACNILVSVKVLDKNTHRFSADYFKNKKDLVLSGLKTEYLDAMALEYTRLKQDTFIVSIFPAARGKLDRVRAILNQFSTIVYEKDIQFFNNGPQNFIHLLYETENWVGSWQNNFAGVKGKTNGCFPENKGLVHIFLIEANNLEILRQAKEQIRSLFKIGNDSIHINDTYDETLKLAEAVFNENSIHWLNHAKIKYCKNFERYINEFKQWLKQENIDKECFCIDTSAVLSAYGLRDCRDLDFLHHNFDAKVSNLNNKYLGSHNTELKYHTYEKDQIIFNPRYYFYYKGVKFASLNVIKLLKTNRNEEKDRHDINLINSIYI
ncbi:MAG: hypothetical protein WDZ41_03575 [Candidatus Babeliales bacterium]